MARARRAIVFLAWGERFIQEVERCSASSVLARYDAVLVTDRCSPVTSDRLHVVRAPFKTQGLIRKTELLDFLPPDYDSYLFLDSDTRVLADIELGFVKAERFGIAVAPAPHYSLDEFWGFGDIMRSEGVGLAGQLQYNTGVIFFRVNEGTRKVFRLWQTLALKYRRVFENDQPFFTLAMEVAGFNPYTLSIGYNYRGFGEAISGIVRIWHSRTAMPSDINAFEQAWPPRGVVDGRVVHPPASSPKKGEKDRVIWIASFPRSGNTLLRTVLRHCFGLYSASLYPDDVGGNRRLAEYIGHLEHVAPGRVLFPPNNPSLVKTHEPPHDGNPAIYLVRNGQAACLSLLLFLDGELSLESIIRGENRFGSWAGHLAGWHPWDRPRTLFLRYEDLLGDLPKVLPRISGFLGRPIISERIAPRESIAQIDGKWVRREERKAGPFPREYLDLFDLVNGEMMRMIGY